MDSEDMLIEIMSRTSLKSLCMMRCVSKEFNKLTYQRCVNDQLKKNNEIVSGYLIQFITWNWRYIIKFAPSPNSTSLDLGFLPYEATILASSEQGIMVFQNSDPMVYGKVFFHVCKPATKQVLTLPTPKLNETIGKFAIVVMGLKPLQYKIIRFSKHPVVKWLGTHYSVCGCDIFDSLTWEWRSLKRIRLPYCVGLMPNSPPITVSSLVYMLLSNYNILKFDAYTEKWKVFSSPISYGYSNPSPMLVKYGGSLGLLYKSTNGTQGCWEIWVLKMDGVWEKEDATVEITKSQLGSLTDLHDLDTSVMINGNTLVFYRFKEHGNNMISKVVLNHNPYQMFFFRSDFEPLDLVHPHA